MIDQLLALVNLGEKIPSAVGWRLIGPYGFSIPEEMLEGVSEGGGEKSSRFTVTALAIYNYSGGSRAKIRVLYSGGFEFRPVASYGRRDVGVKWEHDVENKEFIFFDVPPSDKIEVELFNVYKGFAIDQVLVDGVLVTQFMNKRAIAKAYPSPMWFRIIMPSLAILMVGILGWGAFVVSDVYKKNKDNEVLLGIPSGYSACSPYIFDNPPGTPKDALSRKLKQQGFWMGFILRKNKVERESELYDLDRVVLCSPYEEDAKDAGG